MAAFEYLALDNHGRSKKGVLTGDSSRQVRYLLREQGLFPMAVSSVKDAGSNNRHFRFRRSISVADLAMLTRQLATLIRAGMPLEQSLKAVGDQVRNRRLQTIVAGVRAEITDGVSLHEALGKYPVDFPELYRIMIEAGEASGNLEEVLDRLADYTEQRQILWQKLGMAMIYPLLMTVVAVLIVTALLTYVVPEVVVVFEQTGQQLPILTRWLVTTSHMLRDYGIFIFAVLTGLLIAGHNLLLKKNIRLLWDQLFLELPMIGRIIRTVNTARLARTLAILTDSGVPVLEALNIGSRTIKNLPLRRVLDEAIVSVREGGRLHTALNKKDYFPLLFIHLISAGEDSGELEKMLGRAADHQEKELELTISAATSILEPVIILVMGAVVLFIVLAILTPIFEMNQLVGA